MIEVFDDILNTHDCDNIEQFMTGDEFPWFFSKAGYYDTTTFISEKTKEIVENNSSIKEYFVLSHTTFDERGAVSTFNDNCEVILKQVVKTPYKLLRIKCNLSTKIESFKSHEYNIPHTDFDNLHSKTGIYYVNDSDGDTFFFNNEGTVIQRVTPKKNRFVLFDSNTIHAGSHPAKSNKRLTINYNFEL